jgi:uncharacterized membrane protein YqjE
MPVAWPPGERRNASRFEPHSRMSNPDMWRPCRRALHPRGPVHGVCGTSLGAPRAALTFHSRLARIGTLRATWLVVTPPHRPSTSNASLDTLPTTELMRQVLDETKELVRLETRLAREEIQSDFVQLKSVAVFGGVAVLLALLTLSTLVVALVLALGGGALVAMVIAAALLLVAALFGGVAYQKLPKPPLARTRERLKTDVTQLKEHIQ